MKKEMFTLGVISFTCGALISFFIYTITFPPNRNALCDEVNFPQLIIVSITMGLIFLIFFIILNSMDNK